MALVTWRDTYSLDNPVIDAEHRYLFTLINAFHDGYSSGQPSREGLYALTRLVAYAEQHFRHEEALMLEHHYPDFSRHQLAHEYLYGAIFTLNERLSRDPASMDAEAMHFMQRWLVDHILKEDLAIRDFLGARPAPDRQPA